MSFSPYGADLSPEEADSDTLKRYSLMKRAAAYAAEPQMAGQAAESFPATEVEAVAPAPTSPYAQPPTQRRSHIGQWSRDAQGHLVAPKISYD